MLAARRLILGAFSAQLLVEQEGDPFLSSQFQAYDSLDRGAGAPARLLGGIGSLERFLCCHEVFGGL